MSKLNIVASAVTLLVACGPLTKLSKTADEKLLTLEQCCEAKLKNGGASSVCDQAFEVHDRFVRDWQWAQATGSQHDLKRAERSLVQFLYWADLACGDYDGTTN